MDTTKTCPNCGKALHSNAPAGLCPECLMHAGFPTGTEPDAGQKKFNFRPPTIDELKSSFPQLEVLAFVGQGGMGAVYKARQPMLDRYVALKILPPEAATAPGFTERFTREARALARLNHPNIVAVHEFGQSGGYHYLMMEFVDGANLREMERAQRLIPEQALAIVPKICDALQYAHDEGVVHRDIKPENILVDKKGRVKIADFGIAKILGAEQPHAALTGVVGTPHYMAPEQVEKPQTVDHRADIFSVGVVFYEMLTGELPLGRFAAPSKKVQIDVRLDEVVLRALEKEPEARYQQVTQLKTHVETINTTPAIKSNPDTVPKEAQVSIANKPWVRTVLWIGTVLLLLNFILPHRLHLGGSRHATTTIGLSQPWISWIAHELDDGTFERNVVFNRHSSAFISGVVGMCLVIALLLTRKDRTTGEHRKISVPRWMRQAVLTVAIAVVIAAAVRLVIEPFRAMNDAVAPEITTGSTVFVYKLSRSFHPGEIVIYRWFATGSPDRFLLGRIASPAQDGQVEVERRNESPQRIALNDVIGKVIFNTRSQTKLDRD